MVEADAGSSYSVCAEDFSPALRAIASAIAEQIMPTCVPGCVADTDLVAAGVQPSCTFVQETPRPGGGHPETLEVQACNGTELPEGEDVCYIALVDPDGLSTPSEIDQMSERCAGWGWNLEIDLVRTPGVAAPGGTSMTFSCEYSQNKQQDCPGLP